MWYDGGGDDDDDNNGGGDDGGDGGDGGDDGDGDDDGGDDDGDYGGGDDGGDVESSGDDGGEDGIDSGGECFCMMMVMLVILAEIANYIFLNVITKTHHYNLILGSVYFPTNTPFQNSLHSTPSAFTSAKNWNSVSFQAHKPLYIYTCICFIFTGF